MRRYFRLVDDVTIPKRWHLGSAVLLDGTEPRLRAGIHFNSSETPSISVTHVGRVLDFSLTSFAVPVATRRLADTIRIVAGNDIQYIPVEIAGQAGMVVLNSIRVIRCLDEEESEFIKWTKQDHRPDLAGHYRQITKLVLKSTAIPADAHFFRVEGSLVELIISETVKEAMESAGCLGAKFIELPISCSCR